MKRRELVAGAAAAAVASFLSPGSLAAERPVPGPASRTGTRGGTAPRVAVVGAGAFGGWTAHELARRGAQVTLVDAWGAGHSRSSSGDETRVIRAVYNGDDRYTRMAQRAFGLWHEAEARWGRPMLKRTGAVYVFSGDDAFARASAPVMAAHGLTVAELPLEEARRRFPQMVFDGARTVWWEPGAGFLLARASCELVRADVERAGGAWRQVRALPGTITGGRMGALRLEDGVTIEADAYVFACGPWLGTLFPEAVGKDGIAATRQDVLYLGTPAGDARFDERGCPIWVDFAERLMYGIPGNERRGFKVADDTAGPIVDPTTLDRRVTEAAVRHARRLLARRFPLLARAPIVETRVCQYEYAPAGDFLLDRHPEAANAWLVGGGSGHGFKMGPAIGELVATQVLEGAPVEPKFSYAGFLEARARLRRTRARGTHS